MSVFGGDFLGGLFLCLQLLGDHNRSSRSYDSSESDNRPFGDSPGGNLLVGTDVLSVLLRILDFASAFHGIGEDGLLRVSGLSGHDISFRRGLIIMPVKLARSLFRKDQDSSNVSESTLTMYGIQETK